MVSQSQIARFATISKIQKVAAPANDGAPKGRLTLAPFMAKVEFDAITSGTASDGSPFFTMPDVSIEKPDGTTLVRTVSAFGEAHAMVREVILAGRELEVELTYSGPTMRITGVVIDGTFRKVATAIGKAA